jgi:FkbM family methyltransferase
VIIKQQIRRSRELSAQTTIWCALFEILNRAFIRLKMKNQLGLPVKVVKNAKKFFYMRLGTTDWDTFNVTFLLNEYGFVRNRVPMVDSIVDLGANIGDSTRFFSEQYPNAKIVAIEPDYGNFKICRKNVQHLESSNRVFCKQCFVGATSGYAVVDRSKGEWSYRMDRNSSYGDKIPVITIKQIMAEFNLEEIGLLKCDIEGGECELFSDCSGWITRVKYLVIETNPPYSVDILEAALIAAGGEFVRIHHLVPDGFHELALFGRRDLFSN